MKIPNSLAALILFTVFLPGCRYINWAKEQLPQGRKITYDTNVVRRNIRSLHLYDQFDTLAHFDALWLSDEVRCMYAQVYAQKHGLCDDRYEEFERRQLEENNHYISFYLLAAISEDGKTSLSDKNSVWSIYLEIDGCIYQPVEIKLIDELAPEYELFFGVRLTNFKKSYLVKFDARDIDGEFLLDEGTNYFDLWFKKTDRQAGMRWYLTPEGDVLPRRKKDCDILSYDLKS